MNKIQEVKERANIFTVANYLGINIDRNNKALCCFHNDKNPSMSFHKEKQIFKCFSCGKGRRCNNTCVRITKYKCI